jgi:hypothetical protein
MSGWLGSGAEWRRELAAAVMLGAFMGALGPFGTYFNGPLLVRIAYWVGTSVVGLTVYGVGVRAALCWGRRFHQPTWFVVPLAVVLIAVPASAATAWLVVNLWPKVGPHMRPLDWYAQAVMIALPLSAAVVWSRRAFPVRAPEPAHETPPPAIPPSSFLDRLPPRLGRNLLCLQMEDHYVRAHTDRGSDLILLPLKGAVVELEGEGMQVHRSWWVARAAVVQPVQRGRNLSLRLVNGMEAPVGRSFVAALRANRWLDSDFSP